MDAKEKQNVSNPDENKLPPKMLSTAEVARFLGVHVSTVRRWAKRGPLKSYKIGLGGVLRFKREDILNFVKNAERR